MPTCSYGSGAATGNKPMCDKPATHTVIRTVGGIHIETCRRHADTVKAAMWPYRATVEKL